VEECRRETSCPRDGELAFGDYHEEADSVEWGNNRSTGSQHVRSISTSRAVANIAECDS
jgi:hypothetical protein